ncbi:MAG: OmpW family protein [Frankiaceae bacterium]|nr:OmpW family protein [Arenimonas sp.]
MKCCNKAFFPLIMALGFAGPALASDAGDWTLSLGAHVVNPASNNGSLAGGAFEADVGSDWKPTITGEYFFTPNLGLEVLASLPFKHDISLNGVKAGSTKHLPPTFTLQYHFNGDTVSPFIGAGVNYTVFFDQQTTGPLAGTDLNLSNSWGLAAHAGLDFRLSDKAALRIDARWIDIDTDVSVDGSDVGTVKIDPIVYGLAYVWKF